MKYSSEIREYALNLIRIDTHSHVENFFPDLCKQAEELKHLDTSDELARSKIVALGCKKLYKIDIGQYFKPGVTEELFKAADKFYSKGDKFAFETALDMANIKTQFAFTGQIGFQKHTPENCPLPSFSPRIKLLSFIDNLITGDDKAFCPEWEIEKFCYYKSLCSSLGKLNNLDDYLDILDAKINSWRSYGVIGIKVGLAYTIGLEFGDLSYKSAYEAFNKKENMTDLDIKKVQDYAFRHILLACKRNNFPVIIHTGFLSWGQSNLKQTNPMLLHNIIVDKRYKDLKFVLLHGGYPSYIGETTYLAGTFKNVFIDFTWISWLSRTHFRMALSEWLEMVPNNRFCWGSDSNSPETIVGIDTIVREEISLILEDMVEKQYLDKKSCLSFIKNSYYDTPKKLFGI